MHVDNKRIIHGLWRGERKCIDPKAGDADLWSKICEESHLLVSKDMLVEVESRHQVAALAHLDKRKAMEELT